MVYNLNRLRCLIYKCAEMLPMTQMCCTAMMLTHKHLPDACFDAKNTPWYTRIETSMLP